MSVMAGIVNSTIRAVVIRGRNQCHQLSKYVDLHNMWQLVAMKLGCPWLKHGLQRASCN